MRDRTVVALGLLVALLGCGEGDDEVRAGSGAGAGGAGGAAGDSAAVVGSEGACAEELAYFEHEVLAPILSVRCVGCHNAEGIAAGTRMVLGPPGADLERDYDAVAAVVQAQLQGQPLLLLKPTGLHPDGHTGGTLVPPGTVEYAALAGFAQQASTEACDAPGSVGPSCDVDAPGRPQLRRLAHFEYANSVEDLLGVASEAATRFAADTVVHGFDNNAAALEVTPLLADQIATEAKRVAALAVEDLTRLLPCAPEANDACARQLVTDFGRRAFRRPLTDDEIVRYLMLHRLGSQGGGFSGGVELVLSTMLQSPGFLYRTEIGEASREGEPVTLTPYEVATQLAYGLTGSTPDDALLDAAADGTLATPAGRRAQAERLIATPRGREQVARFVRKWLDVERLASVPKDAERFAALDTDARAALSTELDRFVEHVVFEGEGTLGELLSAPYTFIDARLAAYYGVDPPAETDADGFGRVDAPDPQHAGVLTLGAVMATHARPDGSSPVHRGKLVRERLLCQPLSPPPPGVVVEPPPVDPTLSVRERYAAHSQREPCTSCHRLIDPIGLGLEHYDGIGRFRETEGEHTIDASGEIVQSRETDATFDGAVELAALLADSAEVRDCFALQWFRFAYGVAEDADSACMVERLQDGFEAGGGRVIDLLTESTELTHVVSRQPWSGPVGGPAPADPLAGDPLEPAAGDPAEPTDDPAQASNAAFEVHNDSTWDAGRCDTVRVDNPGAEALDWEVTLVLDGTLSTYWNAVASGTTGAVLFRGADHNRRLEPGMSTEFGYCLQL